MLGISWRHGRRLNCLDEREELRLPVIIFHCYWRWSRPLDQHSPGILRGFLRGRAGPVIVNFLLLTMDRLWSAPLN